MAVQRANRPRLERRQEDRILFGVCGGLGAYFDLDPIYFRLAFVLAVLAGGAGVLAYLILAIIMPAEHTPTGSPRAVIRQNLTDLRSEANDLGRDLGVTGRQAGEGIPPTTTNHRPRDVGATVLIVMGMFFLAANFGWLNWFDFGLLWPFLLIALGVALLLRRSDN